MPMRTTPSSQPGSPDLPGPADALRWWSWWPVLLGPAAMGLTYLAYWLTHVRHWQDWGWYLNKTHHEVLSERLLELTVLVYLIRAWRGRNPAHIILTGLAVAFLWREYHWEWTEVGDQDWTKIILYGALVVLGIWAWHWRERLSAATRAGQLRPWLCAAGCTYVLAQLIARRAFGDHLPYDQDMHKFGWLEEAVETMAHILLLVTAFADRFGRRRA